MRKDDWLSEILGYPVFEVTDAKDTNLVVRQYHEPRSLTYAKVPVADVATVNKLTGLGFRVVDVHGRFESRGFPDTSTRVSQFARPEHHETLLDIASSCFACSRFHRDELTRPHASRIKREWLRNCLEGRRGLEVLVTVGSGGPTGFLAIDHDGDGGRIVDLLGVDPLFRALGVGRALLTEFTTLNAGRILSAGTSLSNTAAVRLYQSCGFRLSSASYVLHLHRGV